MSRFSVAALSAALVVSALLPRLPAGADTAYSVTSHKVAATDGVLLHVDVFRPAGVAADTRLPVAMLISPYIDDTLGLSGRSPHPDHDVLNPDFLGAGYTVVQATMRGFGRSGGCYDFGGLKDQADVKTLVEWAADQPWSTGRVGLAGTSYVAWAGVMALAAKPRGLSAVAVYSPLISAYRGQFLNGVHYGHAWHATAPQYSAGDLTPPGAPLLAPAEVAPYVTGASVECHALHNAFVNVADPSIDYWRERDLVAAASTSDVPVFWTHGFQDANTKPDNFLDVWTNLRGPKRAWFGHFAHGRPYDKTPDGEQRIGGEVLRWFDRWVKQTDAPVEADAPVWVQEDAGPWRAEASWPPADSADYELPLLSGVYVDAPGNWGQRGGLHEWETSDVGAPVPTGVGTWTFSDPLPYQAHLAGVPRVRLSVSAPSPQANVVGLLYDVAPDGKASLISRGAKLLDLATTTSFDLYPSDWILEEGHRIGLLLSGADDGWYDPGHTGRPVPVSSGKVSLPLLRELRTEFDDGQVFKGILTEVDRRIDVPAAIITERTVDAPPPPRQHPPTAH